MKNKFENIDSNITGSIASTNRNTFAIFKSIEASKNNTFATYINIIVTIIMIIVSICTYSKLMPKK